MRTLQEDKKVNDDNSTTHSNKRLPKRIDVSSPIFLYISLSLSLSLSHTQTHSKPFLRSLCASTNLASRSLRLHLLLHLRHLLLIGVRERPRHAQQHHARRHEPETLAAHLQPTTEPRRRRRDRRGEIAALCGWNHVAQGGEPVGERFIVNVGGDV